MSYQHALDLQTQHNHFAMNSMVSGGALFSALPLEAGQWGEGGWGEEKKEGEVETDLRPE